MLIRIFLSVILPIFLMIGLGVVLDRRLRLDLPTLSKLNFYAFVPALSFVKLLDAQVSSAEMGRIALFTVLHALLLLALGWLLFAQRGLRKHRTMLSLGALFHNAGNYGIPLVLLAFGDGPVGVLATVLVVQNFLTFTLGIGLLQHKASSPTAVLAGMLKAPAVWAVAAALAVRTYHLPLPMQVRVPMDHLSNGLVPVALLTLGVQLSRIRMSRGLGALVAVTVMRLAVSPLLAALLARAMGFSPLVSAVLIVSAGFPVAVNVYVLAAEYGQDEELASQSIFVTTLLSALTLSLLLAMVGR